ncbi:MAG: trehalose-6-phosphate synthase [Candidatus Sulfotelmatobacter sp.]
MRLLTFRLTISLIVGITLISLFSSYYEVRSQKRALRRDLEHRAEVLGESLADKVETYLKRGSRKELETIVTRFGEREHLAGVAVYNPQGGSMAITPGLAQRLTSEPAAVQQAATNGQSAGQYLRMGEASFYIYAVPLHQEDAVVGELAIVHDASYINAQSRKVWRDTFLRVLALVLLITVTTLVIVRWSIAGPIARAAQWMHALRTGKITSRPAAPDLDMFRPLAHEMANFAASLAAARSAAEKEAQLRQTADAFWTAERLSVHLRSKLGESRLFVVANREPYIHKHQGKSVEAIVPASGLVTALEPVLRACDGTWVAHGSGDADRETVDKHDRLRVPPDDPRYTLRRVWLSKEEEEGYYYGFSNEGLWPLCHIAHTRPVFRSSDWEHYERANRRFADAVLKEMEGMEHPVLLAQDYHFALLPRMIKKARPDARVAIFWHIPWPNPEAFGICPWQRELVDGLLGADLIGFHIQSHCTNFLQTVDRALESRIDWEHFTVNREEHRTVVKPFPISVEFPENPEPGEATESIYEERVAVLQELGIEAVFLGVGVDRVDYTKGILERFLAIERLMEKHPTYREKFTFLQIGAPSRTHIKRYHDLLVEVESEADRINWRFQTGKWKPIVFMKRQHSHQEIQRFYRIADLCLVTSLHDGMNLVAKEFVAARQDEQGVLILSRFTGAARELPDALLVNPYDIEQMAEAIRSALEMDIEERKTRMQHMRKVVREHNIFRWASTLIAELCEVRLDEPANRTEPQAGRVTGRQSADADAMAIDQAMDDLQPAGRVAAVSDHSGPLLGRRYGVGHGD